MFLPFLYSFHIFAPLTAFMGSAIALKCLETSSLYTCAVLFHWQSSSGKLSVHLLYILFFQSVSK